ncbi:type IX secretion system membrane protein PorP/SprF [Lutibacter sp. B1]|uniref:PorP/SprF family type IX secretion system membrane protein n=1 Tax=Lutibacter sp. B1 TaxID=2725996 RepID=UPI0014569199|nr:type IX secretion system membrane protein PorP/SprF [Lutibacter sp. B1]NLP58629.1 type IX secretion system membrane protein PorP/SprF [Lutibacter sp. B1]
MKIVKFLFFISLFLVTIFTNAQETLPIYSDYLSDNVYLVHPAAAGIGNCGKVRVTARSQWSGIDDAPSLQTLSAHTRINDNMGVGLILFNDENGYHSQQGVQATYAYHLTLGRLDEINQLSFALSLMAVNNSVDESSFTIPDPVISQITQSESYFNADFGMAYHLKGFFSYFTAKNIMLSARNLYNDDYESLNLRRYLVTLGYYFGEGRSFQLEPSIMAQSIERTGEKFVDFNIKAYKNIANAQLWAAFSYRQGFDNAETEELSYITPIVGVNYKNFMVSYTYTKQSGDILFDDAGYHQISLGFNFLCREPRRSGCPNINASF